LSNLLRFDELHREIISTIRYRLFLRIHSRLEWLVGNCSTRSLYVVVAAVGLATSRSPRARIHDGNPIREFLVSLSEDVLTHDFNLPMMF
jgi:hypothetical protein